MKIEDIASMHLGKAGDGTVVKPYVTPDHVTPGLLVSIPRVLNRTQYNIDNNAFHGYDIWNCYEVSSLTESGCPVNAVVRIMYPANSANIVESKSLKLYLNSFNLAPMGRLFTDVIINIKQQIIADLQPHLGDVLVNVIPLCGRHVSNKSPGMLHSWLNMDRYILSRESAGEMTPNLDRSGEDPSLLKSMKEDDVCSQLLHSYSLRSNCRVTNQPDWGDVYIYIESNYYVDIASLYQYIVSMRRENHFHEEICEAIFKRLYDHLPDCKNLMVACLYTRRGGIDINPVRYLVPSPVITNLLHDLGLDAEDHPRKTDRQ